MQQSILATYPVDYILPDLALIETDLTRLSDEPIGHRRDESPIPCDYFGYVERLRSGQAMLGHYRLAGADHAVAVWYPQFQALEAEAAAGLVERLGMFGIALDRACALGMFAGFRRAYPASAFASEKPRPAACRMRPILS